MYISHLTLKTHLHFENNLEFIMKMLVSDMKISELICQMDAKRGKITFGQDGFRWLSRKFDQFYICNIINTLL